MKYSFSTFYSLLVLLLAFSLASIPVNAQGEDEELDDEEDEELLDDDEEEGEEEGPSGKGELSLGESGEEESGGMIGGAQLSPPTFFSKPGGEGAEVKDDEEGEVKKKEEKKKEPEKDVKKEPGWLDKTTKFLEITGYFRFRSDLFYRFDMGFPSDNPNIPFGRPYEARYSPYPQV
ncbi:MAG: hypothetical protein ABIJ56_13550, partial [Pseudomonadota bacterium]